MSDQAESLRQLIRSAPPAARVDVSGPPMIVVAGSRPGVGATTVAVNLAAVLADQAERVLVVDAVDPSGKDAECRSMMEAARIKPADCDRSLSDVLAGRCSAADAIVPGPAGTLLLASHGRGLPKRSRQRGSNQPIDRHSDFSRHAQQRLLAELQSLANDFDLLVADIGSGLTPWTRRFWLRAQLVLLVTTADANALLDAYATIKLSVADKIGPELRLLVNQCDNEREAADIHQRLAGACQRFLGRGVPALPALPREQVSGVGCRMSDVQTPRVWAAPDTAFGHAVLWLGRAVSDVLSSTCAVSAAA